MVKHNVEVLLLVSALRDGQVLFLVDGDADLILPNEPLNDRSSLEAAASLLSAYTGLEARALGVGWVDLFQNPLVDNADRVFGSARYVAVPYACFLPESVPLKRGQWLSIHELAERRFVHDHQDILMKAYHV